VAERRSRTKNTPASVGVAVVGARAGWGKARRDTMHQAERYSQFVRVMKRVLPVTAAALITAVLIFALMPRDVSHMAITFGRLGAIQNDLTMSHPRLTGTDDQGQPFVVTADSAIQAGQGGERAELKKVDADVTLKDGTWINVTSDSGFVDSQAHTLILTGNIGIYSDNGYQAHTPVLSLDLKTGVVQGSSHVEVQGPLGTLSADAFELHRDKKQLFFKGNVHSVFYRTGEKH
jgi:lipopolysaccharide export system protein LptC